MTVSCPGARFVCRALAEVQPQDTRTLITRTGEPVLLTRRKGWTATVPCGTEPKSLESSSNRPSAQEEAWTGQAAAKRTALKRLYRNMVSVLAEETRG